MVLTDLERLKHEKFMRIALMEARLAEEKGEVPIGAVVVVNDKVISKAHNLREVSNRAIAHAELLAIDQANQLLEKWRLEEATLYVTLEPCAMCAGAIILSRVKTVVYGASDPKAGSVGSVINLLDESRFNHQPEVISGILADQCGTKLTHFFRKLRKMKKLSTKSGTYQQNCPH